MLDDNPFTDLRPETHQAIETILGRIYGTCDWSEADEETLAEWREARGEDAKAEWTWWVGEVGCESYADNAPSREAAIEIGRRDYFVEGKFEIVEARLWADSVKDGEDVSAFAESRNRETVNV